jgi:carbonic anhydrase
VKQLLSSLALSFLIVTTLSVGAAAEESSGNSSQEQVLTELLAGNKRFASGERVSFHQDSARLKEVSTGQKPIAAVISCSDSRVPPEVIFDHGLGDLFVIRTAGHVVDNTTLASLEYAVEHLGVSVVIVLGHERCGAVTATVTGGHLPGHLTALTERIKPAIGETTGNTKPDIEKCIGDNSRYVANQLTKAAPVISEFVASGKLKIVAGKYDLDTGLVELL